jgi:ligand-binding SRPBCC domain-containing protein
LITHTLHRVQRFSGTLEAAWQFFARPENLDRITPPWLRFELLSPAPDVMRAGLRIHYKLRPLCGIPVTWTSEIVEVEEPLRFVDVQTKGPYLSWRHEHHFREVPGGVEMEDRVEYALPGGILSEPAHVYIVRPRLARIFEFRRRTVEGLFGPPLS